MLVFAVDPLSIAGVKKRYPYFDTLIAYIGLAICLQNGIHFYLIENQYIIALLKT